MAIPVKKEHPKEEKKAEARKAGAGSMVPMRLMPPVFPALAERVEELLGEPWGLRWPLRWPELAWPQEMVKLPVMDIFEEGDTLVVKAEVPGLAKEELDVKVEGDLLTLSGKKEKEEKIERKDYHRYERSSGSFSRTVRLPAEVEVDKVTAALKEGVLEIRAPKSPAAKARTRKIEVA
jgi:HSP20 family protein